MLTPGPAFSSAIVQLVLSNPMRFHEHCGSPVPGSRLHAVGIANLIKVRGWVVFAFDVRCCELGVSVALCFVQHCQTHYDADGRLPW